ncbi:ABC transporter substrate-binding protein [Agaribacter flavus]|uniref:ABC transporter substrate-binding protein n=1 Tax=Agaribacter flavus TaxID=1902781 RepID=A0ABV7FWL6_9ALTE
MSNHIASKKIISRYLLVFCFYFFLVGKAYSQTVNTINIGVMSPILGGSRDAGEAHELWIRTALSTQQKLVTNKGIYEINLVMKDTESRESDEYCHEQAKELVDQDNVVAIIGPVSSGCVKSVLKGGVEVPIIATLASATSLNDERSPWFFRANGYDRIRIQKLWHYVDRQTVANQNYRWFVLHGDSKYGLGLVEDLREMVNGAVELETLNISSDSSQKVLSPALREALLNNDVHHNFFILGTSDRVIRAIKEITSIAAEHPLAHSIYTVGSSFELLRHSPPSLVTVGEMQFDLSQNSRLKPELERLQEQAKNLEKSLFPTTYQAARFIVPEALRRAIDNTDSLGDLGNLREQIRQQLEIGEFNSLQPPKMVSFNDGNMSDVFEFPIYGIAASFASLANDKENLAWIEFYNSETEFNYLESPIKTTFIAHGLENNTVDIQLRKGNKTVQQRRILNTKDGQKQEVTFHVYTPGNYEVYSTTASFPKFAEYKVSFSPFYLICLCAAFLAVFMKQKITKMTWAYRLELLFEGGVTGLAVAFVSTYIQYSVLPFTASDWNIINGVLYGFVGGWFGPMLITSLTSRVLPGK